MTFQSAPDLSTPDRILRRVELLCARRIDGVGPGGHRSVRRGEGLELADLREYSPGDDVRSIDWNVTARTGSPHVRIFDAERETGAFIVADRSASMGFGTAAKTKEALLREVVAAVSVMMLRRGDRVGGLAFADTPLEGIPLAGGKRSALRLLGLLDRTVPADGRRSRLDVALQEAARVARRRSIVFVVSDWLDAGPWEMPLRRITQHHDTIAVEVRDPREHELPDVGLLLVEDPETGRQLEIDTTHNALRDRFAHAVQEQHAERAQAIARCGASHLVVSTDRDWLGDLLLFLDRRRKARR